MPNIRMPNGTVIQNVPDGITKAQLEAKLRANGFNVEELLTPKEEENFLERIPVVGDFLAGVADLPLKAISGFANVGQTVTDAFGAGNAASEFLGDVGDFARALTSAESRQDQATMQAIQEAAEGKGIWEEVKAAARAFAVAPLDTTAELFGSALPFIAAGAATAATGGGAPAAAGVMAGLGAVSGAGTIKGEIYNAVFEEFSQAGAPEEAARAAAEQAQEYGDKNLDQIGLGAALGALAGATGFTRQAAAVVGQRAAARVAQAAVTQAPAVGARTGALRGAVTGALEEAVPEAIQAGQEKYAQNVALQREGFDVDTWKGVAGQAAFEGIASILLGGLGGVSEARAGNKERILKEAEEEFNAMPPDAPEEVKSAAVQRFIDRGLPEDQAKKVVDNMARQKADIERRAEELKKKQAEALAQRTAQVEPSPEPNINAPGMPEPEQELTPPPVDPEEQAAMERAYAEEQGGFIPPAEAISPTEQLKEQLGGQVIEAAEPEQAAPDMPAQDTITPFRATQILNSPPMLSDFMARFGVDERDAVEMLTAIEEGEPTGLKFSRGRRPKDTETVDMFGALPIQQAPGEAAKRDEFNEFRFAPQEVKEERRRLAAEQFEEESARLQESWKRQDELREETLGDIEYALRAQAPENAVYKVLYEPEDTKAPYKLVAETRLGERGEEVLRAKTLQDFSDQVYGQMMELTPFIPDTYTPPSAVDTPRERGEQRAATPYVRKVQELTKEIDAARAENKITDSEKAELLRRMRRPNAYRTLPNGDKVPNDAIATLEAEYLAAAAAVTGASAQDRQAARKQMQEAAERLNAATDNGLIRPIRKTLAAMVENRQLEREGATIRAEEAKKAIAGVRDKLEAQKDFAAKRGQAPRKFERVPGQRAVAEQVGIEGIGEDTKAESTASRLRRKRGTSATGERVFGELSPEDVVTLREAQRELRDALVDLKETKPTRYRRGVKERTRVDTASAQSVVNAITKGWKAELNIEVVDSVKDITDAKVRSALIRDNAQDAEGFVTPDGTIYLIAENIESEARVKAVLFHEALGHLGLEKLFREDLDKVLMRLYRSNPTLRAQTDQWLEDNPDAYRKDSARIERAVEEVLAERSESGPMKQSFFKQLAAVVRNYLRKIGFRLAVSDADVEAMLFAAHERVTGAYNMGASVKGMRYLGMSTVPSVKYSKPKTTPQHVKALQDAEASMSVGLRRTIKSQNTNAMVDGLSDTIKSRKMKPFLEGLKDNYTGFKPAALKATLYSIPTSGIIDWFGKEIPSLKDIDDRVLRMTNMRANIIKAAEDLALTLDKFLLTDEDKQLARTQHLARINEVSPDEHKTVTDALTNDKVLVELRKRITKNANDKKLAAKLASDIQQLVMDSKDSTKVKGDKRKNSAALNSLLTALEKDAIDQKATARHVGQLAERTRNIRDTYAEWDKLGALKGGQKLYKEMREFYRDMFEAEMALLDARVDGLVDKEEAKRIRDLRAEMMREVVSPEERKKKGDVFWDIDPDLFTKDYFPLMREGNYWVRVVGAKDGSREAESYQFDSAKERNEAQRAIARRLGVDPEDGSVIRIGHSIEELQEDLKSEDLMMQKVFQAVTTAKNKAQAKQMMFEKDINELYDSIYQTWLLSTPERSVRRRLMHAKEEVGYSDDVLHNFWKQVNSYANQLSKMAFAGDIRMQVKAAMESIDDRPTTERAKLAEVVMEMGKRAEQEINPEPQSAWANLLNRTSYFYYLTSAATALVQTTSIPIRVMPRLWSEYGFAEGTAMWMKYMKLWQSLGIARAEKVKTGIGDQLHAMMPSISGSKLINNNTERGKLLQRALKAGMERNVLETVTDTLLQNEREVAKRHREGAGRVAVNAAAEAGKVMGVLFQGMENISRQASYFMAFELEYDAFKKKNPNATEQQAFDAGVRKGLEVVRDTLGEYTSWERPRLAKSNWSRVVFLFKMHAIIQTKFMVQNFRALTKGTWRMGKSALGKGAMSAEQKAEYVMALKELTGVTMMAGMFGGLMGMPLYSIMAWALAEGFDDEDDEDVRRLMGIDPRVAYDSDIMFRKWMADKFGVPMLGDMTLSDVLVHGPIAALTDTDLASRTSLDIKNMWFREAISGDSAGSTLMASAIANIAGLSMVSQWIKGAEDMANGDITTGLKKMLPAFFRSPFAAATNEMEGIKDRKGNVIIPKEDITAADGFRSVLGFRPMGLARWQDYYITRAKNDKQISNERNNILRKLDKKLREGDITTAEEFREFWDSVIVPFNRTYPDPDYIITPATLQKSLEGREESRQETVRGMQLDKKTALRDYEMAKPFMPK